MTSSNSVHLPTYYVIPFRPEKESDAIQPCQYFNEFLLRDEGPLASCPFEPNPGLVRIIHPEFSLLPTAFNEYPLQIDTTVWLFAAVAATLEEDLGLPSLFRASATGSVVIPVAASRLRGVILVFAKKDKHGRILHLRSTSDPKIEIGGDG